MLDLGLTKMAVIGVVSLVVLGPERLPHVARTAGALFGHAQRFINDVKVEVTQEIELKELQQLKSDFVMAAANVQNVMHENLLEHESDLKEAWNGASIASPEGREEAAPLPSLVAETGAWRGSSNVSASTSTLPRRKNWRGTRTATSAWYKRTAVQRRRVQSGAARTTRKAQADLAVRHVFFNI